jgi:hypothetical protein
MDFLKIFQANLPFYLYLYLYFFKVSLKGLNPNTIKKIIVKLRLGVEGS